jgi:hypothetical protein
VFWDDGEMREDLLKKAHTLTETHILILLEMRMTHVET